MILRVAIVLIAVLIGLPAVSRKHEMTRIERWKRLWIGTLLLWML